MEFHKLRELWKDFIPVISKIDRNVDKIYKDIEGENRGTAKPRAGSISHVDCHGNLQNKRVLLSLDGFQLSHTKAIMTLHVRAVLNILGRGYLREQSLRVGRIQKRQRYYGCMAFVSSLWHCSHPITITDRSFHSISWCRKNKACVSTNLLSIPRQSMV